MTIKTLYQLYHGLLRLPEFRGKSRLTAACRRALRAPITRLGNGLKLELDPQEWLQIELAQVGYLEPKTTHLVNSLLRPGDTFVDVGAHVGYLSLTASNAVGAEGKVVAIDPQPYNCNKLLTNASLNRIDNLTLYVAAASDSEGSVTLANQTPSDKARLSLVGPGVNDTDQRFVVPTRRLDTIAEEQGLTSIRLLKIDVEGLELEVLRGARETLQIVDHVVFEVLPETDREKTRAIRVLLNQAGYNLFTVTGVPWAEGRSPIPEFNVWGSRDGASP